MKKLLFFALIALNLSLSTNLFSADGWKEQQRLDNEMIEFLKQIKHHGAKMSKGLQGTKGAEEYAKSWVPAYQRAEKAGILKKYKTLLDNLMLQMNSGTLDQKAVDKIIDDFKKELEMIDETIADSQNLK